jgi:hypothetical protein
VELLDELDVARCWSAASPSAWGNWCVGANLGADNLDADGPESVSPTPVNLSSVMATLPRRKGLSAGRLATLRHHHS